MVSSHHEKYEVIFLTGVKYCESDVPVLIGGKCVITIVCFFDILKNCFNLL